jgi:hypothetical protein
LELVTKEPDFNRMYNLGHPPGTMHGAWHLQMNTSCLQHRLYRRTSGPADAPLVPSNVAQTTGSAIWWWHAKKSKSLPSLCSIIVQAPEMPPSLSAFGRTVFVSKHNPATRSIMPHSSKDTMTSVAWASVYSSGSKFRNTE